MPALRVSEEAARWLLHTAGNNPSLAFNQTDGTPCKLCDFQVLPEHQARHLRDHEAQLNALARERQKRAQKRLREANALRREANAA